MHDLATSWYPPDVTPRVWTGPSFAAYPTDAIEALHRQLREAIKAKGSFPTEDAARRLVYVAIRSAVPRWTQTRGLIASNTSASTHAELSRLLRSCPPTVLRQVPG